MIDRRAPPPPPPSQLAQWALSLWQLALSLTSLAGLVACWTRYGATSLGVPLYLLALVGIQVVRSLREQTAATRQQTDAIRALISVLGRRKEDCK